MTLSFDDRTHRYRLDGRPISGVTAILNGGLPKHALVDWSARVVAEWVADHADEIPSMAVAGREPMVGYLSRLHTEARNAAGARGTLVHHYAQSLMDGQPVDVPPDLAPVVHGYMDWADQHVVQPILTERFVVNRSCWYAGRFDLIAHIGPHVWLLDLKTSRSVYGDTALQTAAYARAEAYVTDDGNERPMPPIDRIGVVHVTNQGTDLYDLGEIDDAFTEFRAAQVIHRTSRRRRMLIGEPVAPAERNAL